MEAVMEMIEHRWGWRPSDEQRHLIWQVADRHGGGSNGYVRLMEMLAAGGPADPIAFLKATDQRLKEAGQASALAQERESRQRRLDEARPRKPGGRGPESLGAILGRVDGGSTQ